MARPQQQNGTSVAAMLPNPVQTYDSGMRKIIITLTVIVSAMLELIDTTIVNVAITQISGNLGASIEDVSWVVTSYAIANVIVIPLSGFLGNLFGRRNYYIGKCIYCQTSMYEKDEQIRPYPFNPHCNCREKAICDKCGKECTEEFLTKQGVVLRHPAFMWKASGLCVNCQNEALKARG